MRHSIGIVILFIGLGFGTACSPVRICSSHTSASFTEASKAVGPENAIARTADLDPAVPLTLDLCIEIALSNNPDIGSRESDAEAFEAQSDEAAGRRWPTLDIVGGYTHYIDSQRLAPFRKPGDVAAFADQIVTADLVVRFPLYAGGLITSEIEAADLLALAAQHRLARTRRELVFNVSSVFFSILAQDRVLDALAFSQKTLVEHLKRVEDLMEVKRAARVDLLRTQVRVAEVEEDLVREKNLREIQLRTLAVLLGIEGSAALPPIEGSLDESREDQDIDQSMAAALEQRKDVQAALTFRDAQARQVDAAGSGHWPTVDLYGSYGGLWGLGDTTKPSGAKDSEDVGRVGLQVDLPLFRGGRVRARIREAEARLRSAEERLRKVRLKVGLEVETAVLNLRSALQRILTASGAIEQAGESLRIEREKYELGRGSILDVLDAQSALLDAQTRRARALAEHNTAMAQLRLARGEE